jgi:hypothetical protein
MISLPTHPRRGSLRAFCLTLAGVLTALGLALAQSFPVPVLTVAAVLLAVFAGAGLRWPNRVRPVFAGWDAAARYFSAAATAVVVAVAYYAILVPVSLLSSRGVRGGWVSRRPQGAATYVRQDLESGRAHGGGLPDLAGWVSRRGCRWRVVLLPYLALARLLDVSAEVRPDPLADANIYTLY